MEDSDAVLSRKAAKNSFNVYRIGRKTKVLTTPLPDPIGKSIEAVVELHNQEMKELAFHQQIVESISGFFSRPIFLYLLIIGLAIWILGSTLNPTAFFSIEFPTFSWSNQGLDTAALLISTGVLVRQSRQEKFAEQRSQLMLQLNLLSEKKIAKVITLLEELRTDLPNVANREDAEAKIMQDAADPVAVLKSLQQNLDQELMNKTMSVE